MPETGHFVLHSNVMPPLTAGKYQLKSEHTGTPFDVADEFTHVDVSSPRYTMPPEQILSSFPPANAEGAFGDRLPQIVLKRRTLPWERNPAGETEPSDTPWLALVVVAEGEAELSETASVDECVTPGTDLLDPQDRDVEKGLYLSVTETVLKKIFPCEEDLRHLTHVREVDINDTELANGDDDGWLAVVMANRLPVFDTATGAPVRYMACLVNVEGQLDALPEPQPAVDFFEFAVVQDWSVLANVAATPDHVVIGTELINVQLPAVLGAADGPPADVPAAARAAAASGAALSVGTALDGSASVTRQVSVASQWASATADVTAAALDPDAKHRVRERMKVGWQYPIELFALEPVYRFPVLAHWSFTTNEGATFETLMQDLDVSLLGSIPVPEPDDPPPAGPPPEVVETGHIGLDHRTRRGDATRAWYRGPLSPFPTERNEPQDGSLPVAHSADQLRRVVPDGREDLSHAAAFEIGRLLGLSQLSVVSALLRFRNEQFGAGRVREVLDLATDFDLPGLLGTPVDLGRFVALTTLDGVVTHADDTIGPRRPIADPGREIRVRGDLDALVAGGLGLDVDAIRKTGEQIGVAAALARTPAPVADRSGRVDERSVAALRDALDVELRRVIDVALPTRPPVLGDTPGTEGRRRRAPAAPARDALDDLIDANERLAAQEEDE